MAVSVTPGSVEFELKLSGLLRSYHCFPMMADLNRNGERVSRVSDSKDRPRDWRRALRDLGIQYMRKVSPFGRAFSNKRVFRPSRY